MVVSTRMENAAIALIPIGVECVEIAEDKSYG